MANDNGVARSKAKAGRGQLPQRRIDPLLLLRAWLATLRDCISNVPRQPVRRLNSAIVRPAFSILARRTAARASCSSSRNLIPSFM